MNFTGFIVVSPRPPGGVTTYELRPAPPVKTSAATVPEERTHLLLSVLGSLSALDEEAGRR